jgi:hypothetical protein
MVSLSTLAGSVGCCAALAAALSVGQALAVERNISIPVLFEANAGQFPAPVRFAAHTPGYRLSLSSRGAALAFPGAKSALEFSFTGANPAPEITGVEPLRSHSSYLLGNDQAKWKRGVPQYRRVRYGSLYPGVDLFWYSANDRMEYDLVLRPGADPRKIRMRVRGAGSLRITPDGDLAVQAEGVHFLHKKPLLYQEGPAGRTLVAGRYRLLGRDQVGFEVGAYDRARTLTIDPVLMYATMLGGVGSTTIKAVKVDSQGMVYVVGSINQGDVASYDGVYWPNYVSGTDVFLAVFNPALRDADSLYYFTYLGGTGNDIPNDMALDAAGNVYITGSTTSADFPTKGNAVSTELTLDDADDTDDDTDTSTDGTSGTDLFVAVLHPGWQALDDLVYATYLGGEAKDVAYGIAVDSDGVIYVTGGTTSTDFPVSDGAYQTINWNGHDSFVSKIDPNSASPLVYSSYLGGELWDEGRSIAVAPNGLVYAAGNTTGSQFPLAGASQSNMPGRICPFLTTWDMTKSGLESLVYSGYFGGSSISEVRKIALDPQGRLLLTGYTASEDFPVTGDALKRTVSGFADAFVTRLEMNGANAAVLSYSTFLGGSGDEVGYDIASDGTSIYVTGYTVSSDFPTTPDAFQGAFGGGADIFLTRIVTGATPSTLGYSTYVGGSATYVGYGLAVSSNGTMYLGGNAANGEMPVTPGTYQGGYGGGAVNGFLMMLAPDAKAAQ